MRIGLAVIAVILAWLYALPYFMLLFSPFTWSEADINKDGFVSPTEADYFGSYGKRQHKENGKECVEYFAMKDGVTLKTTCE